ncbi:hypothetical protein EVAR_68093_1 [Eumeta japonica]|uniref:Uncharacterized protein n=1 Tax=Eumeta variegata TaxID=151549 RepID=A0A4C2A0D0_EUMVA|nr:hypothetical protein EVAR_68093_1 [Eumeta japonica]
MKASEQINDGGGPPASGVAEVMQLDDVIVSISTLDSVDNGYLGNDSRSTDTEAHQLSLTEQTSSGNNASGVTVHTEGDCAPGHAKNDAPAVDRNYMNDPATVSNVHAFNGALD